MPRVIVLVAGVFPYALPYYSIGNGSVCRAYVFSEPLHQAIALGKPPLARLAEARGGSLACEMAGRFDAAHDIARVLCRGS